MVRIVAFYRCKSILNQLGVQNDDECDDGDDGDDGDECDDGDDSDFEVDFDKDED